MGKVIFGSDPDPHSAYISRVLARLGAPGGCVWEEVQSGGITFWMAAALCSASDEFVAHPLHPDSPEPAVRKWWQRDNLVIAKGTDKERVIWEAERLQLIEDQVTVWFSRMQHKYIFVPRAPRHGPCGVPESLRPQDV